VPKRQPCEWKSKSTPRKQKFRLDKSKGKVMIEIFLTQASIHYEIIPEGRIVNEEMYVEILRRFRMYREENFQKIAKIWLFLHENTLAQCSSYGTTTIFPGFVTERIFSFCD
jgi:hypothetical protein